MERSTKNVLIMSDELREYLLSAYREGTTHVHQGEILPGTVVGVDISICLYDVFAAEVARNGKKQSS